MLSAITLLVSSTHAQSVVADFETFTLSPNSFYKDTNNVSFMTTNASFMYHWTKGNYPYWSGGFSYTNKYDSATAGFGNLYGVKPLKGYNSSSNYVVAQDRGVISLLSTSSNTVEGFYITNTTYAYKSMKLGDAFSKKFGGATGNDPDFFKVKILGYKSGLKKTDSIEFYLADFRFANNTLDYIVNNWQWVDVTKLGAVDSIKFFMSSSDLGAFGINTPLFFGIDNFTTNGLITSLEKFDSQATIDTYPNPFNETIKIFSEDKFARINVIDMLGKIVYEAIKEESFIEVDLSDLQNGVYFVEITSDKQKTTKKIIKN